MRLAAERFCAPLPPPSPYSWVNEPNGEATVAEKSLPLLVKALAAGGLDDALARVIRFVQAAPDAFRMDQGQVPALCAVIPWAAQRLGTVPAPLAAWLADVRRQLEAATAHAPRRRPIRRTPPT